MMIPLQPKTLLFTIIAASVNAADLLPCQMEILEYPSLEAKGIMPHPADRMGTIGFANYQTETRVDVYHCKPMDHIVYDEAWLERQNTLIVFAADTPLYVPGSNATQPNAGKNALHAFALTLARHGYLTVMADRPNLYLNISAFIPVDFLRVIDFMQSGAYTTDGHAVEIKSAVIGGHSFGGSMAGYALTHVCPTAFCPPTPWDNEDGFNLSPLTDVVDPDHHYEFDDADLATFDLVQAAFWYGGMSEWGHDSTLVGGHGVPILMMYGSEDEAFFGKEQRGLELYEQWNTDDVDYIGDENESEGKAFLVFEGLDHDGITDVPVSMHEDSNPSSISKERRAEKIVDSIVVWLDSVLGVAEDEPPSSSSSYDETNGFCKVVIEELGEDIVRLCLPESMEGSSDNSDEGDTKLGYQIGIPVGIGAPLLLVFVFMLVMKRSGRHSDNYPGEVHDGLQKPDARDVEETEGATEGAWGHATLEEKAAPKE